MTDYIFPPPPVVSLPVTGHPERYALRRIFCVGRNYAAHAAEMGSEVSRAAPWFFTKSLSAVAEPGEALALPPGTESYHHEVELVVALDTGGAPWGYGVGLDMTRRDLQATAKEKRLPWDTAKDVEQGAILGPLTPATAWSPEGGAIRLEVNGTPRQQAPLSDMVWSVAEILDHLSRLYTLGAGDLVMTGTPAGVGPVVAGDRLLGEVDGLAPLRVEFVR